MNNLEKYKKDLDQLLDKGSMLMNAMYNETYPDETKKQVGENYEEFVKNYLYLRTLIKLGIRNP